MAVRKRLVKRDVTGNGSTDVWDQVGDTRTSRRSRQLGAHRERTVVTEGGAVADQQNGGATPGASTLIDARHGRRAPQSWRSTACLPQLLAGTSRSGTIWGPHVMHGDERSARLCTSRTAANRPQTRGDQRKRVAAIYWGSSGRRFKSCQPDKSKWLLTCGNHFASV
jgi:hypothetical protein